MAYRKLEDHGWIEARPQSGYYVKRRAWREPPEPQITAPPARTTPVNMGDMVVKILRDGMRGDVVPLGAAVSGTELLPVKQLSRLAGMIARRSPVAASSYDPSPGHEPLRVQVARRAMEAGCALSPDDIVTTTGSQEAMGLCLRAVAKAGDTIAIESPTYYGLLQQIEVLGMRALEIPMHPRDGVSLEALELALDREAVKACLFVTNFNNPLGCSMPEENKQRLVKMLDRRGIPLIEDDIYGDLPHDGPRPGTCKMYDETGNVMLCSSFSKTLAPGYRVGWCAPGRWREQVTRLKLYTTLATATLPQMAVAEFLANGGYEHHLRKVRRMYAEQVSRAREAVCKYFPPGTKATSPKGGFVLWVELPGGVDSLELHERALKERISIAPGPIFSATMRYRNFVRLNCGYTWSDRIEGAMKRLGEMVGEMGA
jgi:DNA-binding transcriptional MocR family regulator